MAKTAKLTPIPVPQKYSDTGLYVASLSQEIYPPTTSKAAKLRDYCTDRAPGVALSVALAHLSLSMAKTSLGTHISPLLWATIFGMVYGNLLHSPEAKKIACRWSQVLQRPPLKVWNYLVWI